MPSEAESRYAGEDRWVPSIAVTGGYAFQEMSGDVDSACQGGGPGSGQLFVNCSFINWPPRQSAELRPSADGDDWVVSPYLGASVQIMTPALTFIPGRPRFFASGEAAAFFPQRHQLAVEGQPSTPSVPDPDDVTGTPSLAIDGTGSKTTAKQETLIYGANFGIAFPFKWFGRQMWIKPSVGWVHYEIDVTGKVSAGIKNDRPSDPQFGDDWRSILLTGGTSPDYHAIGPALELEMQAGTFGQLGVSLFLNGAAYKILGDRDKHFEAETPIVTGALPLRPDQYYANWNYEIEPWLTRLGVGIRFSFLGL